MLTRTARKARRQSRQPAASIMADPYYQGDAAFHAGVSHYDCPYDSGDGKADWLEGWMDANALVPLIDKEQVLT